MPTVSSVGKAKKLLEADKQLALEMIAKAGEKRLDKDPAPAPWDPTQMPLGRRLLDVVRHLDTHTGYGTRGPVVLNDGASLTGQDITLGSIDTGQVSGTARLPAGYSLMLRTMGLRVGQYGYLPIVDEIDPADPAFTCQVPQLSEGKIAVSLKAGNQAEDSSTATRAVAPGTSGISVTLSAAVSLLQPADGATGINGSTLFSWTQFPGGVHTLSITVTFPASPNLMHILKVVTAGTSFTIDGLLPALIRGYLGGNPCYWAVSASTLCPTVDAAASSYASDAAPADSEVATRTIRTFTSAP